MLLVMEGSIRGCGTASELALDTLTVIGNFNKLVEEDEINKELLLEMFENDPETITTFTKNFVQATH